jgi:diaminohydroxyphosphoribosylaminopyrimidine deaminase/5-amino-6-(5-phosphoribosylamino)uracil reductase
MSNEGREQTEHDITSRERRNLLNTHGSPDVHTMFMRRALELAERGWGQTAPNPMVGAVVVQQGEIVGEGYHQRYGEPHAEPNALREAKERARGATLYVTLEPCNHTGATPPCTNAIINAGIARVVIATRDPNPIAGGGVQRLREAEIEVIEGVCEAEARELNAPFLHSFTSDLPWVTLKLALSLDGAIADAERNKGWITNELSRAEVQRLRANADAVAVGVGTVIADNPELTARTNPPPRVSPLRVVFDRSGRTPKDRTIVKTSGETPTLIVSERDIAQALRTLKAERGIRSILFEGGAGIAAELLRRDLVDRLVIFQAPIILGRGALNAFEGVPPVHVAHAARLPVVRRQAFGDDLMTVYALHAI